MLVLSESTIFPFPRHAGTFLRMPRACPVENHARCLEKEREGPADLPLASSDATPLRRGSSRSSLEKEREEPGDKPLASGQLRNHARSTSSICSVSTGLDR